MILYHGSRNKYDVLKPQQAEAGEGVSVPEGELLKAVYLTPNYEFAVMCAARPDGLTHTNDDDHTIEFKEPESYDPERTVYIYEVETDNFPAEHVIKVDENQVAIIEEDEVNFESIREIKAGELEKYYEIRPFNKEADREIIGENDLNHIERK